MSASLPRGPIPARAPLYKGFRAFEVVVDGVGHHAVEFNKVGPDNVVYRASCGKSGMESVWAFRYRRPGSPTPTCILCYGSLPSEAL